MKSLVRAVLFTLISVPIAACGGDREVATPPSTSPVGHGSSAAPQRAPARVEPVAPSVQVRPVAVPDAKPTTYGEALALGKQLAGRGEHSRARELFELALKLDKQQVEPHIELARLFIASGDRALAIRSANRAVKLAPGSSQAYNTLGRAELARFRYDNAINAFREATERNADNVWAWNNLGYTYLQLEQYEEAAEALAEATSRTGTTGYMWNNLGTAYEHLDQLDDARLAFEQGGALGSAEATASRQRLEGVDSIAIFTPAPKPERMYEPREEMPSFEPDALDEEPVDEEMKVDEAGVRDEIGADELAPVNPI